MSGVRVPPSPFKSKIKKTKNLYNLFTYDNKRGNKEMPKKKKKSVKRTGRKAPKKGKKKRYAGKKRKRG